MSKNMLRLLKFALSYPQGWHTCGRDATRAMNALEALGLIEVRRYSQTKTFKPLPQFRIKLGSEA